MTERESPCRIEATEAAAAALGDLRAEHGELILHLGGGAEAAGTPACLPVGELRIGSRDVFLGRVPLGDAAGVDVYEQRSRPEGHHRFGWTIALDLAPGLAPGFSLPPRDGTCFAIRDSRPSPDAPPAPASPPNPAQR